MVKGVVKAHLGKQAGGLGRGRPEARKRCSEMTATARLQQGHGVELPMVLGLMHLPLKTQLSMGAREAQPLAATTTHEQQASGAFSKGHPRGKPQRVYMRQGQTRLCLGRGGKGSELL